MEHSEIKLPVYAKLAQIILGIIGFFYILYIGQDIIIPVLFATIIAILLNPVVNWLHSHKVNRIVAIALSLLGIFLIVGGILYFIGSQIANFSDSWPQLKTKASELASNVITWVSQTFHVDQKKIDGWIQETKKGIDGGMIVGQTLSTLAGLAVVIILPVYIFLILYYKPLLLEFISRLFRKNDKGMVNEVLTETKSLIQNYLVGLSIEAVIVAVLNTVGLLIIGVQYAALLGILGALLNIIPYLGGLIAIVLSMLVALATGSPSDALWVCISYLVVQFVDNNYLVPNIVASKVKINAFISILVVLIGGALWGIPGMFLSIPLTAILKVVFDRVEALAPFGYLLGDAQDDQKKPAKKKTKASA